MGVHTELAKEKILKDHLEKENQRLRDALREIRDVARCSDGVEFYAMLAKQALDE